MPTKLTTVKTGVPTPLEFVKEAISLSGVTGTKLKCDVVGKYYPFWWKITSGGKGISYRKPTAIVELCRHGGGLHQRNW
jgi:hypothetical protein